MRVLPERADHDRQGAARQEPQPDRRADSRGHGRRAVPLHDVLPRSGRHQAAAVAMRSAAAEPKRKVGSMTSLTNVPRRTFLKGSGLLVVGAAASARTIRVAHSGRERTGGAVSRPRLPAARFVDRHPRGQHGDFLRRQDRLRPGHRHRIPPDDGRRARHRLRQDDLHHGQHRRHASTRADRADRTRSRPMAGRCGASPPKRGECCSRWRRRRFAVPVDQLAVSDGGRSR